MKMMPKKASSKMNAKKKMVAMQKGGAKAAPAPMMKKGGKMSKCKYGCK
jgi:hypothetical protein